MCGLAGLITTMPAVARDLAGCARRMIAPLTHRGPDDFGVWTDDDAGIALGFRRLSILDLSPSGHQPMRSASGRFVLAFNGEIYNFQELGNELTSRGHRFRGHSDTEVALAAFDEWGIDHAVGRFVGMFAMAIWDATERRLSLVRDRIGKKPLYVYARPGLITFGSELKALVAGPSFDRTVDRDAVTAYLRYLYVPAPKTIFAHAIKVPPAHILRVTDPRRPLPSSACYWSLEDVAARGLDRPLVCSDADAIDALEVELAEAVRCRLRADVPLGALLSGGIDSSTVVALMQRASTRPVKTFTIGFAEQGFDEATHAKAIAHHLGTDHTELRLTGKDASVLLPRVADIFDEPFADPSQLPTLLVSRLARRDVTVALSGDGGDELFGGYNRYVYGMRMLPRIVRIPRALRRPIGAVIGQIPLPLWNWGYRRLAGLLPPTPPNQFGIRAHKLGCLLHEATAAGMYRSLLSAWQHPADVLAGPEFGGGDDMSRRILNSHQPRHLLDRMMLADQLTYLPDDLLAKLDRASMAVSLEVRAPLLDQRVIEFSWRLPRDMKIRAGVGKWALRHVLARHVPAALIDRPKMGFSVPIDAWLRGPLRAWTRDLLSDATLKHDGWLNPGAVGRALTALDAGSPVGTSVWALLILQAWRARWQT